METSKQKAEKNRADVDSVIASLTGILPDTGKTLEEYREERLKKYGFLKSFCQILNLVKTGDVKRVLPHHLISAATLF